MRITKVVVHVERDTRDDPEDSSKQITITGDKVQLSNMEGTTPAVQRPRDVRLAHDIMELMRNYNGDASGRASRRMFRV